MAKACPNFNSNEWKYLVDNIGEHEAMKIFISNGDVLPEMEDLISIVDNFINDDISEYSIVEIAKVFNNPSEFNQEDFDNLQDMGYTEDEILDRLNSKKSEIVIAKNLNFDFNVNDSSYQAQKIIKQLQSADIITKTRFNNEYWVKRTELYQAPGTYQPENTQRKNLEKIDQLNRNLGYNAIIVQKKGLGYTIKINPQMGLFDKSATDGNYEQENWVDNQFINEVLFENKQEIDIKDLANNLSLAVQMSNDDSLVAASNLIQANIGKLGDVKIRLVDNLQDNTVRGIYNAFNNEISINKSLFNIQSPDVTIRTVTEEILHALTAQPFWKREKDIKLSSSERKFVAQVDTLYLEARNAIKSRNYQYRLLNQREFIVGALIDPQFKSLLDVVEDTDNRSLFERIIESIVNFFLQPFGKSYKNSNSYKEDFEGNLTNYITTFLDNQDSIKSLDHYLTEDEVFEDADKIYENKVKKKAEIKEEEKARLKNQVTKLIDYLKSITSSDRRREGAVQESFQYLRNQARNLNETTIDELDFFFDFVEETNSILKVEYDKLKKLKASESITNDEKLSILHRIYYSGVEFSGVINELQDIRSELFNNDYLGELIGNIIDTKSRIDTDYKNMVFDIVPDMLSSILEPTTQKIADRINKDIEHYKGRLALAAKYGSKEVKKIEDKIKELEKELSTNLNTSSKKIEEWLRGNMGDVGFMSSYLEAAISSSSPVIGGLSKNIKDRLNEVAPALLAFNNEMQSEIDEYAKNTGRNINDIEQFNRPLIQTYQMVSDKNEDGTFKYEEKQALLDIYNGDHVKILQEFQWRINDINNKLRGKLSNEESENLKKQRISIQQERKQFYKEYIEQRYLQEVHDAMDLLYEDLGGYTAYDYVGNLYSRIDEVERAIEGTQDESILDTLYEQLEDYNFQLKDLRRIYSKDPNSKEYKVAQQLQKRTEALKKYREFYTPDKNEARFIREKKRIDSGFTSGQITKKQRDYWYQYNTVTKLAPSYWETKLSLIDQINQVVSDLGIKSEKNKENAELYKNLEDIVKVYRDQEGIIDGTKVTDKERIDIKDIEEQIEAIKANIPNIFGLSRMEREEVAQLESRIQDLEDNMSFTVDSAERNSYAQEIEQLNIRLDELVSKKRKLDKTLVKKYFDLNRQLSELDEHSPTHYYEEKYEEELTKYKAKINIDNIPNKFSIELSTYENQGGNWTVMGINDKPQVVTLAQVQQAFRDYVASETFSSTKWYKDNHVLKFKFVKDIEVSNMTGMTEGEWKEVPEPLYHWRQTTPTNEKHISRNTPSFKYQKSRIKKEFLNPNYKDVTDNTANPKIFDGSPFVNKKYLELSKSTDPKDKATIKYLNYLNKVHRRSQEHIPFSHRLGNDLPSIPKSKTERLQATSLRDQAGNLIGSVRDVFRGEQYDLQSNAQDVDILYGYQDNITGMIPIKWTRPIDIKDQSIDLARSIGIFHSDALIREKLTKTLPLARAIQNVTNLPENAPVQKEKGIVSTIKRKYLGNNRALARRVQGESNTSKQINELISSIYYGERFHDQNIMGLSRKQINYGFGLGARLMLGFNYGSAIMNAGNAMMQSLLEAESKTYRTFTAKDYVKANNLYYSNLHNIIDDIPKYGNKSYISQFVQYFGGATFDIQSNQSKSLAWQNKSNIVNKILIPTEIAEHGVGHILVLAIGQNYKVTDKDGNPIPLYEAFEIVEGKFKPKEGIQWSDKDYTEVINRINAAGRRINGEYGKIDAPRASKDLIGQSFLFMNKYFTPFFVARFGAKTFNAQDGIQEAGFWRQSFSTIWKDLRNLELNIAKNWANYTDAEKQTLQKAGTEITYSLLFLGLVMALGGDEPDQLRENGIFENNMIYILNGLRRQNETFLLLPGLGLDDAYNKLNNPFPLMTKIRNAKDFLQHLTFTAGYYAGVPWIKPNDIIYQRDTGFNEEGDYKMFSDLKKLFAIRRIEGYLNPAEAVKNLEAAKR